MAKDDIRNVFRDPQPGDEISYYGDIYTVTKLERHPGKVLVVVTINGVANRTRNISKESWREYEDDGATVLVNRSVLEAFDDTE